MKGPSIAESERPVSPGHGRGHVTVGAVVFLSAMVMGGPAILGTFLSGDDIQLARDHVLVNHPSIPHAFELFRIVHRDLYQPMALLSLSFDFVITEALGLTPDGSSTPPGAWLFHLTNVILHGVNSLLVFTLLSRITARNHVAAITALLFALHPMGAETVAWLSGRMMLLSTMFLLGAVIVMDKYGTDGRWCRVPPFLLLVACCMTSKVCVSAPILLLLPLLYRKCRPNVRWSAVWAAAAAMTVAFAWINYEASSGMIARGEEHLKGSRLARTILALAWYLRHTVVPTGLAPHHPAAETVDWSHPGVLAGLGLLIGVFGAVAWFGRRGRGGWVAMVWFLASIAATLPLIPARNIAVAERYAYLPNIGLYWIIAAIMVRLGEHLRSVAPRRAAATISAAAAVATAAALCAMSWRTISYYRDDVCRTARIAELYPDDPGLGARHAWSLYHAGRYDEAIASAEATLGRHGAAVASDALQVIGMSRFHAGREEAALETLAKAIEADDGDGMAYARYGSVLKRIGRTEEAIAAYERCAELLPNQNPDLVQLAELYRQVGRNQQARRVYEQVLDNNPYDVSATLGIAELDMLRTEYRGALTRLKSLLDWMPENVAARINAGVCLASLGEREEALTQYAKALEDDPDAALAVINMAGILLQMDQPDRAEAVLAAFLSRHPTHRRALELAGDVLVARGRLVDVAAMWVQAVDREPRAADLRGRYAWVCILGQKWELAGEQAAMAVALDPTDAWGRIAECVAALHRGASWEAVKIAEGLVTDGAIKNAAVFDALCLALEAQSRSVESDPWPYYVLCMACVAVDRSEAAESAAEAFRQRAGDPAIRNQIDALLGHD